MTTSADLATAQRRRWTYSLALLALLTCPCHLVLLAVLLSGSAAGALLTEHFDVALMFFSVLFLLPLNAAIWVWRGKGSDGR
ncbi:MAG: mercury resistance protein [Beggiatoa sp.]|nr:mercury resistance protein [Beggiatoa sp.]